MPFAHPKNCGKNLLFCFLFHLRLLGLHRRLFLSSRFCTLKLPGFIIMHTFFSAKVRIRRLLALAHERIAYMNDVWGNIVFCVHTGKPYYLTRMLEYCCYYSLPLSLYIIFEIPTHILVQSLMFSESFNAWILFSRFTFNLIKKLTMRLAFGIFSPMRMLYRTLFMVRLRFYFHHIDAHGTQTHSHVPAEAILSNDFRCRLE